MSNTRRITWLKGDYVGNHEREAQALREGCKLVIEFHFNSDGSTASGGETWYKPDDQLSLAIATDIRNRYQNIGLGLHGPGPNAAVASTRAGWLPYYSCSAILLEPLFVSNPNGAAWIHDAANVDLLATQIAAAVIAHTAEEDIIGLSIGHRFKHSSPNDMGAACVLGDSEATHGTATAEAVAAKLTSIAITPAVAPQPDQRSLDASMFKGNTILEAVAAGHAVLQATGRPVAGAEFVQDALNSLSARNQSYAVNLGNDRQYRGYFGEKTEAALEAFQKDHRLEINGRVDQATIHALDDAVAAEESSHLDAQPATHPVAGNKQLVEVLSERVYTDHGPITRSVNVYTLPGKAGYFYLAKMSIDADGAPKCYHPTDDRLALDNLNNATSNSMRYVQGRNGIGPAEGFYVSQTSLNSGPANDCGSFVDAVNIPYVVFPGGWRDVVLGDCGVVYNRKNEKLTHVIFADTNPKVGEASIKTAANIGLTQKQQSAKGGGIDEDIFVYLIFPGTRFTPKPTSPHWPDADIKQVADAAFSAWGGIEQLKACIS